MKGSSWKPLIYDFNKSSKFKIKNIIEGKNPALIIKNFYDKKSCDIACSKVIDYTTHAHEEGVIKKIGVFLSAYLQNPNDYFNKVLSEQKKVTEVFLNIEDPLEKIKLVFSNSLHLKVDVARQDNMLYSSSIIRIHEPGDYAPLHRDNVNFEARAFSVSKYSSQISCVLHLKPAQIGGEIKIYKQFWKKQDEKYRNPGFGYSNKVLNSPEHIVIRPDIGDLVIINPLYYHEILPVKKSNRISFGTFLGFSQNLNKAILWA